MAGYRKLGRTASQRKALLRNQVTALLNNGKIVTTVTRAKETKAMADKMITLGKRAAANKEVSLHCRRQALAYITKEDVVTKVFAEYATKYADRNGGYTRIMQTGPRRGDAAPMAILELV